PPLRERMDELEALTNYFLEKYGPKYGRAHIKLSPGLLAAMQQYDWPGNIRELENVVRRYIVLHDTNLVETELANAIRARLEKSVNLVKPSPANGQQISLKERVNSLKKKAEAEAILQALNRTNWNRKEAAKSLNISYKSFLYRMKVLDIGGKSG
ncbi:MAG TPA: helix-turn-helix domain-containing protein, partial [Terriglobia bacterium]|nr:helix-turn-helix domain-containing protein [Terriglobia bacterium]